MIEALTQLCQEKHIDELVLLDRLEQSLAKSYEDVLHINTKAGEKARVTISRETGKIYVYKLVPQEDSYDEELDAYTAYDEFDVTPSDTSRIAAQHAKAEINNLVRNAARTQIYKEFSDRLGDMITGTVLQVTNEFTILKIREGVEAELPYFDQRRNENERNERPAGERYAHNQRIKAIIIDVRDPNGNSAPVRGDRSRPSIVVSRTSPELLARLFEQEVPEIYEGSVEIHSIARDPGVRSKVAVSSFDDRLDPVGACVGPKGSRVRAVVTELRGERVDVILWDEDPRKFVANALSPAKVSRVVVDPETGYATSSFPTTSSRSPSARRVRTPASPPASPASTSTSRTRPSPQTSYASFPSSTFPRRKRAAIAASTWARTACSAATWHAPDPATAASTRPWPATPTCPCPTTPIP